LRLSLLGFGPAAVSTHRPPAPLNISVVQQRNGLMLKWLPPRLTPGSTDRHRRIRAYVVQYRTVGQWVDLTDKIDAERTWYYHGQFYSMFHESYA